MKEGMINFVRGNKDKIFVVEFANKNRLPFDIDCGIDFASHMAEIPNLRRGISIGSEAFCSSVIAQLEIGDIYNTTILGRVARERNAVYLRKQGWM
jgi:hypothetical protein